MQPLSSTSALPSCNPCPVPQLCHHATPVQYLSFAIMQPLSSTSALPSCNPCPVPSFAIMQPLSSTSALPSCNPCPVPQLCHHATPVQYLSFAIMQPLSSTSALPSCNPCPVPQLCHHATPVQYLSFAITQRSIAVLQLGGGGVRSCQEAGACSCAVRSSGSVGPSTPAARLISPPICSLKVQLQRCMFFLCLLDSNRKHCACAIVVLVHECLLCKYQVSL